MANRSKSKGTRAERAIVELLRSYGFTAHRVPLSGAAAGFKGDVQASINNETFRLESKVRGKGFARIYNWLEGNDALVIKADHRDPLAIIPLHRLASILSRNGHSQTGKDADKPPPIINAGQPSIKTQPQLISIDPSAFSTSVTINPK